MRAWACFWLNISLSRIGEYLYHRPREALRYMGYHFIAPLANAMKTRWELTGKSPWILYWEYLALLIIGPQ